MLKSRRLVDNKGDLGIEVANRAGPARYDKGWLKHGTLGYMAGPIRAGTIA